METTAYRIWVDLFVMHRAKAQKSI